MCISTLALFVIRPIIGKIMGNPANTACGEDLGNDIISCMVIENMSRLSLIKLIKDLVRPEHMAYLQSLSLNILMSPKRLITFFAIYGSANLAL